MNKIQAILSLAPGQSSDRLESALTDEARRSSSLVPKGTRIRRAYHLADDPVMKVPHGSAVTGEPKFDAVFEIGSKGADLSGLMSALGGLADRLQGLIDPARSAVIAGEEHVIVPGQAPLMLVYALRPLPSLTPQQFHDYWLNQHAGTATEAVTGEAVPTVKETGPQLRGYRQFHADSKATKAAASALRLAIDDFEGVAEGYFTDYDEVLQVMSQPEVVSVALEDEKKFIDVTRSVLIITRVASDTTI